MDNKKVLAIRQELSLFELLTSEDDLITLVAPKALSTQTLLPYYLLFNGEIGISPASHFISAKALQRQIS